MPVPRRLAKSFLVAFGSTAALGALPVRAQEAAPPPAVQRVEITGSSIRRTDSETPSPVQVITAEELRQTGFTSIQDVLHNITANGQGTLSQGFATAFASGASGVSLRGLTVGATLVLIDGHRVAPYPIGDDGQRSFVDISSIPFDAVERIEVLKDGASAVYGSDAIAGVVNVILKRSYTGTTLNADIGVSGHGDGTTRHASAIWGTGDMDKDGHNTYLAAEWRNQDQIRYSDRGGWFTHTDYTSQGGYDTTPGVPVPAVNGGLPFSSTGYVTDPDGNILGFMPGCDLTKFNAGQCAYHDHWSQIQPATTNVNLLWRTAIRFAPTWQVKLDGTYFISKAEQVTGPSTTFPTGYQGITSGPGVTPTVLPALDPTSIPATNPSFPTGTGASSGQLYYTFLDLGPTVTATESRTTRLSGDIAGQAGAWDLDTAFGFSQVRLMIRGYGYVDPANLQEALDRTTDPYLVGGPNSPDVLSFIAPTLSTDDVSKLYFVHLGAGRDLTNLAGGPLQIAFGADYVHRSQDATAPAPVEQGLVPNFSNNFTIGTQDVRSVYGELAAPVTKTLELDLQARWDDYNLSGSRLSPKAGFKWTPTQVFALRGTYSRGFRAPNPAENGVAGQTYFTGAENDPVLCADGNPTTPGNFPTQCAVAVGTIQTTNAALKPELSKSWTFGTVLEPTKGLSATLDLYAIELDHQIVPNSNRTTVRGSNLTPIPQVQADGTTKLVVPPVAPIAYFTNDYINADTTSTSGVDLELDAKQRLGNYGEWNSDFTLSYMWKYDLTIDGVTYHLAGSHGPSVVGGDTGNPRMRMRWANTWSRGPGEVTGTINYIGKYSLIDPSDPYSSTCLDAIVNNGAGFQGFVDATTVPPGINCHVNPFVTFDLEGKYQISKAFALHGGVLNVFNAGAPQDWSTYGGGIAPYNPSLHQQGAIGRFFTVGATYEF
jgi:iron complex outermembrane receptor protein